MSNADFNRRRSNYRKKRRQVELALYLALSILVLTIILIVIFVAVAKNRKVSMREIKKPEPVYVVEVAPEIEVDLLSINTQSRPGIALEEVKGIVVHYTANPGTSAKQNRNYFENLKDQKKTFASSHFVIGLEGEIVQCVPCNEIAYASNDRNEDTISIECCIEDEDGKFNQETYESLLHLVTWLMGRYDLTTEQVIRHYDCEGSNHKNCPKYYVENEQAWKQFKVDLSSYIILHGTEKIDKTEE